MIKEAPKEIYADNELAHDEDGINCIGEGCWHTYQSKGFVKYTRSDLVKPLVDFIKAQKPLDPDIQKFIDDNFWDLI